MIEFFNLLDLICHMNDDTVREKVRNRTLVVLGR